MTIEEYSENKERQKKLSAFFKEYGEDSIFEIWLNFIGYVKKLEDENEELNDIPF